MSIRWKMSLFYSSLLAILISVFSIVIYISLQNYLHKQIIDLAHSRAQLIDSYSGGSQTSHGSSASTPGLADEFASLGVYIQTTNASGRITDQSKNLGLRQLPLSDEDLLEVLAGQKVTKDIDFPNAKSDKVGFEHMLLRLEPIREADEVVGVVQIGIPLTATDELLQRVLKLLLLAASLAIILALPLGLLLAGRLLAPIGRITNVAATIAKGDLSQRINHKGQADEVGKLATTFDKMIAVVDSTLQRQRRFLSDASHELRTPITAILGHANFLRRHPEAAVSEQEEAIETIVTEGSRMSRLIDNLLHLLRTDDNNNLIRLEPVALDSLLKEVFNQTDQVEQNIKIELSNFKETTVLANRDQLKQVICNLLDNAIKFSSPNAQIELALRQIDGFAQLSVKDNGIGISEKSLPHIFERFYRADPSRSKEQDGYGLGLAIANQIVESHGGKIEVESKIGLGSSFTIYLPLHK